MANFEVIASKFPPSGGAVVNEERLIFIDNGGGASFTLSVATGDGTYPSAAGSIVAGAPVFVAGGASPFTASVIKPAADSTTAIQIENAGQTSTLMCFDTTDGFVGINVTPPAVTLDIAQNGAASVQITAFRAAVNAGNVTLNHARGTQAAPAAVLANDRAGTIFFQAFNQNGTFVETGELTFVQTDAVSGSAHGLFRIAVGSGPSAIFSATQVTTGAIEKPQFSMGAASGNTGSVLAVSDTVTGQTVTGRGINIIAAGSFDTTAGALTGYGLFSSVTHTRLAGGNNLTNIGGYFNATSAQVNIACQFDAGAVNINSGVLGFGSLTAPDTGITRNAAGVLEVDNGSAGTIATITARVVLPAGTATVSNGVGGAPLNFVSGTNLTSPTAGAVEFDGVQFYHTIDTTSGRGAGPVEQYFHLTSNGSPITTIANFFGSTSNISLVSGAHYEIEMWLWMVTTGTGAVTITLTNNVAPTSQNIYWEESPATGVVAPPGTATMLVGQTLNDTTATKAIATASLSAATHFIHIRIWLINSTGSSLKIQATAGGTNLTPQIGSWWKATRRSPNNIGTFAA